MALVCARMVSVRVIRSTKVAWAIAKEVDVAVKVWTKVIMARKAWGEMGIVSIGAAEVLGPAESIGTGRIRGSNEVGGGLVAVGIMDVGMWGSSTGATGGGWSFSRSLRGRGGAPDTNCHFSTVKMASQTRRRSKWGLAGKPRCSNT